MSNSTQNYTNWVCHGAHFVDFKHSFSVQVTAAATAAISIPLSVVTSLGNFLILYTITMTETLHTPANFLLAGLSVTDLTVGVIGLPLFAAMRILEYHNIHICPLKHAFLLVTTLGTGLSVYGIAFVSIDRYLAVLHLKKYKEWKLKRKYLIFMPFLLCSWSLFPILRLTNVINGKGFTMGIIFTIFFCFAVVVVCYIRIFFKVRKQERSVMEIVGDTDIQDQARSRERHRLVTIGFVSLGLLICYVPKAICLISVRHDRDSFDAFYNCNRIPELLLMLNSTLNPFLYCYRIMAIRVEVVRQIKRFLGIKPAADTSGVGNTTH